jgi:flavodoxin
MHVLVIYHSRSGHTRDAAEAIARAARERSCDVAVKSAAEVRQVDIEKADMLFVGTWVHGMILFGVRPAGAEQWIPSLPPFNGKPVGVFCTYAFHPRGSLKALSELLEARGAIICTQRAFYRSRPGDGAEELVRSMLWSVQALTASAD